VKRWILAAAAFSLVVATAAADAKKPAKPDLSQVLLALQADLQKSGWWQIVPVGQNPNDATYISFLTDAFVALGAQNLNGHDLEKLICQAQQGGAC
jgi:hypothetical protein